MAYVNPGNLMIDPSGPGSAYHYSVVSNPPPHPSVMHSQMPEYWVLPDGRHVVHLPRSLNYTPPMETFPPITFSVRGWPGVRIKDLTRNQVIVDDPYSTPMAHLGWRATVLNLEWPGYPRSTFHDPQILRFDVVTPQGPITRQDLASQVANVVQYFHQAAQNKNIAKGFEKWSLKEGIRPSDVILLSIHYYRTQWIPELYIFE
ncbi:hypothetical protein EDD16DRAFT_1566325 [Pisolithus croceorrhizus]|nr:hypothetical protein EDD16DRAFT_1566325 [Pisolithus croceorrhizus]